MNIRQSVLYLSLLGFLSLPIASKADTISLTSDCENTHSLQVKTPVSGDAPLNGGIEVLVRGGHFSNLITFDISKRIGTFEPYAGYSVEIGGSGNESLGHPYLGIEIKAPFTDKNAGLDLRYRGLDKNKLSVGAFLKI